MGKTRLRDKMTVMNSKGQKIVLNIVRYNRAEVHILIYSTVPGLILLTKW